MRHRRRGIYRCERTGVPWRPIPPSPEYRGSHDNAVQVAVLPFGCDSARVSRAFRGVGAGHQAADTPLRTALDELREFRENYADAYNNKDSATVAGMYAPDAVVIQGNGTVLVGKDAIRTAIAANAPSWGQLTITSDTVRVVGNTAWDVGTARTQRAGAGEQVSHYLTVYRRGLKSWKLVRLAVVPESHPANAADSAAH